MKPCLRARCAILGLAILASVGAVAAICLAQEKPNDSATPPGTLAAAAAPAPAGNRFAILVGCTAYKKYNNPSFNDLEGPANDIPLLRKMLEKYKFQDDHITELSEAAAIRMKDEKYLPTRANIARELGDLPTKDKLKTGDFVVILLSGHGCQQPETVQNDLHYAKPDGYDSIFLPEDIGRWDGKEHKVANAIPDFELRKWTKAITHTGASLWIIVDACCSGYTLRNGGREVARKVEPSQLGIPDAELQAANQRARQRGGTRGLGQEKSSFSLADQSPDFVGLYAAQPDEPTVELPLPEGPTRSQIERKTYGLLTYTICELLEKSANKLSYAELHRLICNSYDQAGHHSGPHPWIEGLAQKREVLGVDVPGRSQWVLADGNDNTWSVDAGKLLGLTDNSILAVYRPANQKDADKPLGHLKVADSELLKSTVIAWDNDKKSPAADASYLKPGLRCEPVFIDFGSMRLTLGVDIEHAKTPALVAKLQQLKKALGAMHGRPMAGSVAASDQDPQLFDLVDDVNGAQWVVQERAGKIALLDRDGTQILDDSKLPTGTPLFQIPVDGSVDPAVEVSRLVRQIFRGQNLLQLTTKLLTNGAPPQRDSRGIAKDSAAIDVEVQMLQFKNVEDPKGEPLPSPGGQMTVRPGMIVGWKAINHSQFAVDVTLLFIGSDFDVAPVYPSRPGGDFDNWLPEFGERIVRKSQVTGDPLGEERMVVFAVPHEGPAHNYAFSALSTSDAARSASRGSRGADSAFNSKLGQLLQYAIFADATTGMRGMDFAHQLTASYKADLLGWRVVAGDAVGAK